MVGEKVFVLLVYKNVRRVCIFSKGSLLNKNDLYIIKCICFYRFIVCWNFFIRELI